MTRQAAASISPKRLRSCEEWVLFSYMCLWALALPVLRRALRLDTLAQLMWRESRPGSCAVDPARLVELSRIAARRRPPTSENRCLERSLLAYRFLAARGADPKLVVALRREDVAPRGHAWVAVGGEAVGEPEPLEEYVPIVVFGRRGRRET